MQIFSFSTQIPANPTRQFQCKSQDFFSQKPQKKHALKSLIINGQDNALKKLIASIVVGCLSIISPLNRLKEKIIQLKLLAISEWIGTNYLLTLLTLRPFSKHSRAHLKVPQRCFFREIHLKWFHHKWLIVRRNCVAFPFVMEIFMHN